MEVEPGWYHHEGDPAGTVRLWNGSEWIGFPTQPPPGYGDGADIESQQATGTKRRVVARPLKNQVRLAPYAVFALLGLGGTAFFAATALRALRGELGTLLG